MLAGMADVDVSVSVTRVWSDEWQMDIRLKLAIRKSVWNSIFIEVSSLTPTEPSSSIPPTPSSAQISVPHSNESKGHRSKRDCLH
jgi:hypothetical protein